MLAASSLPLTQLKPVLEILDRTPVIASEMLALADWATRYYHAPPGEVFESLLPADMRRGGAAKTDRHLAWHLTTAGTAALLEGIRLGPRQRALLEEARTSVLTRSTRANPGRSRLLREAVRRGWLETTEAEVVRAASPAIDSKAFKPLNEGQAEILNRLQTTAGSFGVSLLHGVTGSGKTEIYLHLAREVLARQGQVLVLVPEIGLTEQIVRRFEERFGAAVGLVHSDLTDHQRGLTWQRCREGVVRVLLGTRSAVWMPMPNLQLIIVDEEHDASFKQQEGLRYSARDMAVMRARQLGIPVVLGSATPSLESLANCERGKYHYLTLAERAGGAVLPTIRVVDVRGTRLSAGLSDTLRAAILARAARGEQSLLFLNRRGYAPVAVCHACGWIAECPRCDARLVLHLERSRLRCHHCGFERGTTDALPGHACGRVESWSSLGLGTEQLESSLAELFPGLRVLRIDRDAMRKRRDLEQAFAQIRGGEVDLLVGTQMIAKGHDFANVTLVGIVDGDGGLLARDFRAEERFAQLVLQVAGRAGRSTRPGEVLIQSHCPEHPLFAYLRAGDYLGFARRALVEREETEMPPHTALAMLRAEATQRELPGQFLRALADALRLRLPVGVFIGGPVSALMERREGRFRANLLLTARERAVLSAALDTTLDLISQSPLARRVRWHLDVDALEIA